MNPSFSVGNGKREADTFLGEMFLAVWWLVNRCASPQSFTLRITRMAALSLGTKSPKFMWNIARKNSGFHASTLFRT